MHLSAVASASVNSTDSGTLHKVSIRKGECPSAVGTAMLPLPIIPCAPRNILHDAIAVRSDAHKAAGVKASIRVGNGALGG